MYLLYSDSNKTSINGNMQAEKTRSDMSSRALFRTAGDSTNPNCLLPHQLCKLLVNIFTDNSLSAEYCRSGNFPGL